jgi:hypothetical protein
MCNLLIDMAGCWMLDAKNRSGTEVASYWKRNRISSLIFEAVFIKKRE